MSREPGTLKRAAEDKRVIQSQKSVRHPIPKNKIYDQIQQLYDRYHIKLKYSYFGGGAKPPTPLAQTHSKHASVTGQNPFSSFSQLNDKKSLFQQTIK